MIVCPVFFPLGDKWVLLHRPMRTALVRTGYHLRNGHDAGCIIGDWTPGALHDRHRLPPANWGRYFYAPQSVATPDGLRIMIGWMG